METWILELCPRGIAKRSFIPILRIYGRINTPAFERGRRMSEMIHRSSLSDGDSPVAKTRGGCATGILHKFPLSLFFIFLPRMLIAVGAPTQRARTLLAFPDKREKKSISRDPRRSRSRSPRSTRRSGRRKAVGSRSRRCRSSSTV